MRRTGFSDVNLADIRKLETSINEKEVKKRRLIRDAKYQANKRKRTKENIQTVCNNDEKAAKLLKSSNRQVLGRPRYEIPMKMIHYLSIITYYLCR